MKYSFLNMPAGPKTCSLCGKSGHNLATCPLKGAQKFRDLLLRDKQEKHKPKARYVRQDGVHAKSTRNNGRKPGKKTNVKKNYSKKASEAYSGKFSAAKPRWDRDWDGPTPGNLNKWKAVEAMLSAGYLKQPSRCASCHHGSLQGPFERYSVALEGSLYWRCDNHACKAWRALLDLMHFFGQRFYSKFLWLKG